MQLFDLVPTQSYIAERIGVKGDLPIRGTYECAVKRVSIAEYQLVGSRFGLRLDSLNTGETNAEQRYEGDGGGIL